MALVRRQRSGGLSYPSMGAGAPAPAGGPAAAPAMANPGTASSPAFRSSLDRQRMVEARKAAVFANAAPAPADAAGRAHRAAYVEGQVAAAEDSAANLGKGDNYFQGRMLANEADTRATNESNAGVSLMGQQGGLLASQAGVNDQQAKTMGMMAPVMVRQGEAGVRATEAGTAGQLETNKQVAPNAAAARAGAYAGARVQDAAAAGQEGQNALQRQYGGQVMQTQIEGARAGVEGVRAGTDHQKTMTGLAPKMVEADNYGKTAQGNLYNSEAWSKLNPPAAAPTNQLSAEESVAAREKAVGARAKEIAEQQGMFSRKPQEARRKAEAEYDAQINAARGRQGAAAPAAPAAGATMIVLDPATGKMVRKPVGRPAGAARL